MYFIGFSAQEFSSKSYHELYLQDNCLTRNGNTDSESKEFCRAIENLVKIFFNFRVVEICLEANVAG